MSVETAGDPFQKDGRRSTFAVIRWLAALLVGLGAVVYYFHGVADQTLCHQVAERGRVLEVCGPPSANELVPFALVIVLLMLPDLSELAVPGLLSLKRTVNQQEGRQERLESKLAQVEQRVEQRVSFKVDLHTAEREVRVKEVVLRESEGGAFDGAEANRPSEDVGWTDELPAGPTVGAAEPLEPTTRSLPGLDNTEDDLRASLTMQLAWLIENLTQYETISKLRRIDQAERMAGLDEGQQQVVDRWYNVFEEEIDLVKEFRNALLHSPYSIEIDELREAVRIGRRLMRILLSGLDLSTAALDRYPEP